MATSGSTSIKVTEWDTLKFSWSLDSQSTANNTSTLSWKLELIAGSSGRISSTASKDWSVTINGTKYSGTNTIGVSNNSTITLASSSSSGKTTITHNSDGTKTFSYSFSQEFAITFSGTYIGTKTGSGSGTLTTIARKSSLSVAAGTLGTAQTLTVSRQSTSFTHTITYSCSSASGTICTKSSSTSISFTPPISLASQNTTGTSVSIKFTITTYSGSTSIGSNSYTKTFTIPSSVVPTISLAVEDSLGYYDTFGAYIQGLSKFAVTITASGSYGSTIKSYKSTANDKSYTAASYTTGVIASSGTQSITASVTDSRSRTASTSKSVTILTYSVPKITDISITRCDEDGTLNSSGEYLELKFSAEVATLNNKNTANYVVQYKKSTDTEYTNVALDDYDNNYSVSNGSYRFEADKTSSYDVILTVKDSLKSISRSASGSSINKVWSIFKKGLGIAFGKIADIQGLFDVDMPARFRQGITIDSIWNPLTLDSAFLVYNNVATNQPCYKVSGNTVTVKGAVSPAEEYTSSLEKVVFARGIPAEYCPVNGAESFICQGSSMNRWQLTVETDGSLTVSRYGVTEPTTVLVNTWLIFSCTYQI